MSSHHQQPEPRAEEYRKLAALLHAWTGIRLHAKQHLMVSRLASHLRERGLHRYRDYLSMLQEQGRDSPEGQAFINALTTNKTSFFREAHHFSFLVEQLFEEIRARANAGGPRRVRLYSAGCSRGAEPYTMALLAAAHLPAAHGWNVRILATDLDTDVLKEAARGIYSAEELDDVPAALRKRWFVSEPEGLRVHPEAASLVTFKRANLIAQPFPVKGKFDAVFCRNVMIYFDRPTQEQLVADLCRLIKPDGYLVVGHSEGLLGQHMERAPNVVGVYRPHRKTKGQRGRSLAPEAHVLGPPLVSKARSLAPKRRSLAAEAPLPAAQANAPVATSRSLTPKARSVRPKNPARTSNAARKRASGVSARPTRNPSLRPRSSKLPARRTREADSPRTSAHPLATKRVRPKPPLPGLPQQRIVLGEWFTATEATLVSTLLGSCVAACLYDPVAHVGGMNHFMLPSSKDDAGSGARFGVHAMEILINELMRKGADRRRLHAKAFGAAAVNRILTSDVAAQNGEFIRNFLARENIPLIAERLGGIEAREVYMRTDNGEVHVRRIAATQVDKIAKTELEAWRRISLRPPPAQSFNPDDALL